MNLNRNLVFSSVVVMALLLLSSCSVKVDSSPAAEPAAVSQPAGSSISSPATEGDTITIRGCHADPQFLEVKDRETVVFVNTDGQEHTIFFTEEQFLPAKGTLILTVIAPMPPPFTINYLCDTQYAGAVVITE